MNVRKAYPPNIRALEEVFGPIVRGSGVIFTFAPHVYVPSGKPLTPALEAHEAIHLEQQGDAPLAWWEAYLSDEEFRFDQELPAHRAEWASFKRHEKDSHLRARMHRAIIRRLASPLYGSMCTTQRAAKLIRR